MDAQQPAQQPADEEPRAKRQCVAADEEPRAKPQCVIAAVEVAEDAEVKRYMTATITDEERKLLLEQMPTGSRAFSSKSHVTRWVLGQDDTRGPLPQPETVESKVLEAVKGLKWTTETVPRQSDVTLFLSQEPLFGIRDAMPQGTVVRATMYSSDKAPELYWAAVPAEARDKAVELSQKTLVFDCILPLTAKLEKQLQIERVRWFWFPPVVPSDGKGYEVVADYTIVAI